MAAALPYIKADLNPSVLQLQWVGSIFSVILGMTMVLVGKLGDLFGKKKIFYIGSLLFAVGAIGGGSAATIQALILFRGLQAIGASILFIISVAALSDVFPQEERVSAISYWGMTTGLGLAVGPLIGGILVHFLSWRWVFWVNLPIIAIGLILCSFSLVAPDRPKSIHPDWKRFALFIVSLGAMLYGIVETAETAGQSHLGWATLIVGPVILIGLIIFDCRSSQPIFNHKMFIVPELRLSILSCATAGIVSGVFLFFDPLYLHTIKQEPPLLLGVWTGVIPMTQVIASFSFQWLRRILSLANILILSMVAGLIGMGCHLTFSANTSSLGLLIPFMFLGMNWAFGNLAGVTLANEKLPAHQTGEGIGTIATVWNTVSAVFLALSSVLFQRTHGPFLNQFTSAVWLNVVYTFVVTLYAFYVWKSHSLFKQKEL